MEVGICRELPTPQNQQLNSLPLKIGWEAPNWNSSEPTIFFQGVNLRLVSGNDLMSLSTSSTFESMIFRLKPVWWDIRTHSLEGKRFVFFFERAFMIIVHMVHVDHVGIFVDFQFCKKVINSPKIHSFQFPTSPLLRKTPLRRRRQGAVEASVGAKRVLHEALLKQRHAAPFILYQFCRLEISQSWLVKIG